LPARPPGFPPPRGLPPSAERALGLAAGFAAGCACSSVSGRHQGLAITLGLLLPGFLLLRRSRRAGAAGATAALLVAAIAGAAAACAAAHLDPTEDLLRRLAAHGFAPGRTPVRIAGTLLDRENVAPDRMALVLRLDEVVCPAGARGAGEPGHGVRARITLPPPDDGAPWWRPGARLEMTVRLGLPRAYGNPGAFDIAAYYRTLGIGLTGSCKSPRLVLEHGEGPALLHAGARTRIALVEALDRAAVSEPPGTAAFLEALLLGEREAIDPRDEETLKRSGVYHILALSGFNVALIAAAAGGILVVLPLPPRVRRILVLAVIVLYALIARPSGSIARAVVMALLCGAGALFGRRVAPAGALGAAAALLLLVRPAWIADPGFQLSFAATLGLLFDARRGAAAAPATGLSGRALRALRSAVRASAAALLSTAPFTARHFQSLNAAGLIANLAAVPLASLLLLLAALAAPLALVGPLAAAPLMACATPLIAALRSSASACAAIPGGSIFVQPPSWRVVAAACLATLGFGALRSSAGRIACAALLAILGAGLVLRGRIVRPDGRLQIVVLDVGQGDSILVRLPGGGAVLVDAGGRPGDDFDVGARVVAPALRALGVLKLDLLVVTHPHRDHLGGAASILRAFRPEALWLGDSSRGDRRYAGAEQAAQEIGAAIVRPRRGVHLTWQGVRFAVLNPAGARAAPRAVGNDDSLALRLAWGRQAALLPGDLEHAAEEAIAAAGEPLAAGFLKVAHHGSATSSCDAFLAAVRPREAVVSAGEGNPWGHPSPVVLARLRHSGCRVHVTMQEGALRARTDGREPWRIRALTSVPDEAEDLGGRGDEGKDEDDQAQESDRPPARVERSDVVHRPRMPGPDEAEQDAEQHQVIAPEEKSEPDQERRQDARDPPVSPRRQGIDHVSAVELSYRQEVERGGEQPEPRRHHEGVQLNRLPGIRVEEQAVGEIQEKTRGECDLTRGGRGAGDGRMPQPVPEEREKRREAGERSRHADVEEGPAVVERRADADHRPEGSEQVGARQEKRQGRIDPIVAAGDVVPHFVRAQDADGSQREGESPGPQGRGPEDLAESGAAERVRLGHDRSRERGAEQGRHETDAVDPGGEGAARPPARRRKGNFRELRPDRTLTGSFQATSSCADSCRA
jgi:competence protein ComEC